MSDYLPTVNLGTGRTALEISCAVYWTCAILDDDSYKCWGDGDKGQVLLTSFPIFSIFGLFKCVK